MLQEGSLLLASVEKNFPVTGLCVTIQEERSHFRGAGRVTEGLRGMLDENYSHSVDMLLQYMFAIVEKSCGRREDGDKAKRNFHTLRQLLKISADCWGDRWNCNE